MRFKNKCVIRKTTKACSIIFPYAGIKNGRGRMVGPNGMSDELPSDRFFDPLLQRDWKNGAIELYFNAKDKAILGDVIADLVKEEVEVDIPEKPEETEKPEVVANTGAPESVVEPTEVKPVTKPDTGEVIVKPAKAPKKAAAKRKPRAAAKPKAKGETKRNPKTTATPVEKPSSGSVTAKMPKEAHDAVKQPKGIQNMQDMEPGNFAGGMSLADLQNANKKNK